MNTRRQFTQSLLGAAALGATGLPWAAQAQGTPELAKILVGFPPGGTTDALSRLVADKLRGSYARNMLVDNKPGAGGQIAITNLKNAEADGNTLLFNASTYPIAPMVMRAPYDVQKDFSPIVLVAQAPLAVSVNNDLPARDVASLLAHARANPGKLNFAIGSTGSAGHLSTELLKRAGGIDLTIVPYKGTAPAMQDLVGGQIQGFVDPLLGAMNFHKSGKLRIIAITSRNRVPNLPDVPTVHETLPGYEFYSWYGVWAPAGTPADVIARLNAEANKALASDMKDKLEAQGLIVNGGSVADIVRFQREDMARSQKIITDGNIRAQ